MTCEKCGSRHGPGEFISEADCREAEGHRAAIEATKSLLAPLQEAARRRIAVAAQHAKAKHDKTGRCDCEHQYAAIDRGET